MRQSPSHLLQTLTPYLFLLPAGFVLAVTVFFPTAQAFLLSFTRYEYDLTQAPQWIGWANFQRLWSDPLFWKTLGQTLLYLVCVVPVLVTVPLLLAILVNRQLKGISWFRAAYYTPVIVSMVVAGLAWKYLYAENGLFNQVLQRLGIENGLPWLTSPKFALFSVMAVTVWKGLGYYMVVYLAGLQSISEDLYEAASLDGSDGWRKHWDITVPLMRPYLLLVATISALSATKVFEEVYVMTQGGPRDSSKTVVYYLYEQAFDRLEISYACTIGFVLFSIVLGLSFANLKLTQR
ncbi:MAG: sugar ABC transporter permease [Cyanobacteria bacterium SID2]|nr:sugar ABC transporter permease [Cyanobacteria bacterium SID2]MBP0006803.1 sugar ABC transporter permease [Cyanobacteria bacterium SBC]